MSPLLPSWARRAAVRSWPLGPPPPAPTSTAGIHSCPFEADPGIVPSGHQTFGTHRSHHTGDRCQRHHVRHIGPDPVPRAAAHRGARPGAAAGGAGASGEWGAGGVTESTACARARSQPSQMLTLRQGQALRSCSPFHPATPSFGLLLGSLQRCETRVEQPARASRVRDEACSRGWTYSPRKRRRCSPSAAGSIL